MPHLISCTLPVIEAKWYDDGEGGKENVCIIDKCTEGGPGEAAGLENGDRIVTWNGLPVKSGWGGVRLSFGHQTSPAKHIKCCFRNSFCTQFKFLAFNFTQSFRLSSRKAM
jgi:hypothetical protein